MQSRGLSRVFSSTTIQNHQFFSTRLSLWSNSHTLRICPSINRLENGTSQAKGHCTSSALHTKLNTQLCTSSPSFAESSNDRPPAVSHLEKILPNFSPLFLPWHNLTAGPEETDPLNVVPALNCHETKSLACPVICAKSLQLCLTLCNPMDCSPPGSSIHRILKTRTLKWVVISSSRGSSWPKKWTPSLRSPASTGGFFFLPLAPPRKPSLSAVHRAKSAAKSGRSCTAKRGRLIALCWPLVKCRPHPLNSSHGGQDPCWQSCWIYYTLGIQRDGGQYPMISQRVLKQLETIRNEMNVHTKFITHT